MNSEVQFYSTFMGHDAMIRVTFEITEWGSPATGHFGRPEDYDPGSDADWSIYDIGVTLLMENGDGAEWMIDPSSRQFRLLGNSGDVVNGILEQIAEEEECRPYWRGRRAYSSHAEW